MSLINEALKKAQNQRANPPGSTPPGGAPPVNTVPGAAELPPSSPFGKAGLLIAICAVVVSLSVVTTVYLLRSPSSPQVNAVVAPPNLVSEAARVEAGHFPEKDSSAPLPKPAAPAVSVTAAPGSLAGPQPSVAAPKGDLNKLPLVSATNAPEVAAAPVTPPPEPTPVKVTLRIQALVDKFRVTGIRLSDTDSKVILNEHLFRVDDPVESSIGLRLTKIAEHRLTFVDAEGNVYVKRF